MITRFRNKTLAVVAALAISAIAAAPAAAQATNTSRVQLPIVGTVGATGTFGGTLTLNRFVTQNGTLTLLGTVTGILTNTVNGVTTTTSVLQNIAIPITPAQITGTCDILHLDLGPLHLTLLGLNVDLSRVVLDITATAGPGNLLGNLLCAVAGLLDNPGGGLASLLNRILGALQL